MLLYIIPFVLLLVVIVVVLKKRGSGQQETDSNRSTKRKVEQKKKAKARSTTETAADENTASVDVQAKSKDIDPALRKQIDSLIRERNFNNAEALINQALNANSQQHDLYLLLLEIHIEQNDQFSIKQLMSHLQTLNLYDVIREAEQRLSEKKEPAVKATAAQYTPIPLPEEEPVPEVKAVIEPAVVPAKAPVEKPTALDFDVLKTDDDAAKTAPATEGLSFDKLQEELHSAPVTPQPKTDDYAPLEFNIDTAGEPVEEKAKATETHPFAVEPRSIETRGPEHFSHKVEFGQQDDKIADAAKKEHHDSIAKLHQEALRKIENDVVRIEKPEHEATALNFDFSEVKAPEPKVELSIEPMPSADVAFNFDQTEEKQDLDFKTELKTETQAPVETPEIAFSFDKVVTEAKVEPEAPVETPEINFSFDKVVTEAKVEPEAPVETPEINFSFDKVVTEAKVEPEAPVETPEINFSFDQAKIEPVVEAAPVFNLEPEPSSFTQLDVEPTPVIAVIEEPVFNTASATDYVVAQFPELAELNEVELNLSLAEQYIRLGAIDSARALLEASDLRYNADELERAKYLLNQIAS